MPLYSVSSPQFSASRSYNSRGTPTTTTPRSKPLTTQRGRGSTTTSAPLTTAGRGVGQPVTTRADIPSTVGGGRQGFRPDRVTNPLVSATSRYVERVMPTIVPNAQRQLATNQFVDQLSPLLAKGMADAEIAPQLSEFQLQMGLNNSGYAAQVEGFNAARQQAADEYAYAMASLANSARGQTDKRWLLDAQLALQQKYYDRLAEMYRDQTSAANRQSPLLAAQKADNQNLYNITVGGLERDRAQAIDEDEVARFNITQRAATEAGWQNKGVKLRTRTQANDFSRAIADVEAGLEKARIGKDANDRELTEKELQIADQLAQLQRDSAGAEDRRIGDYQQYLYDVSTLGRQAAQDRLDAKRAADNRRNQLASIAAQQQQASVNRQLTNSNLSLQMLQAQQNAATQAMSYIGNYKQMLHNTGQSSQAQRFFDWFLDDATKRQGVPMEQAVQFLAGYLQAGNPLVIPPNAARAAAGRYKMGNLR